VKQNWLRLAGMGVSAAIAVVSSETAWAQVATQVTGVSVVPTNGGMEVILETQSGERPQIFLVERGDSLVADLVNTRLSLPDGGGFRQDNPTPGIASVVVTPLDTNSTRVIVNGTTGAPNGEVSQQDPRGIVFSYLSPAGAPTAQAPTPPPTTAQLPPVTNPDPISPNPDVLVPNPPITIQGGPSTPGAPINPAPSLLPRAVPPPVGDIAVSNIDPSPSPIDMGTVERVPRLVLKDAPVQDVLALLARAAGMNVAFFEGAQNPEDAAQTTAAAGLKISLDIENESVQDVFNNVLRLSGLEASRQGSTIIVGSNLPDSARNLVSRTLRLNQIPLLVARDFLISQGAETTEVQTREQIQTQTLGPDTAPIITRSTQTQVELLTADAADEPYQGSGPLPLRGLTFSVARRGVGDIDVGNEITLVGEPRKVEIATALLTQLETRRPQVAVNVKIIDVNLLNDERFNSSFSFGIGDTFVTSDGGSAVVNFGGAQPPNSDQFNASPTTPTVIPNPLSGDPFLRDEFFNPNRFGQGVPDASEPFGEGGRPFDPDITGFTAATAATSELVEVPLLNADGTQRVDENGDPISIFERVITPGTAAEYEFSLPALFQYPTRFLANLRAQVVSGNAKILTDPTLIVQEGETATVNLTNQVAQRVNVSFTDTPNGQRETREVEVVDVGLILNVQVQRIDDNGFVTLVTNPTVSSPGGDTIDLGEGQSFTPIQRRTVTSGRVRVRDGQTLILSGIIQDQDRTTVTKWPILGDLPLIGALFRNTSTENRRNEVIVLLTPNIMRDTDTSTFGYGYTPGPEARELLEQNNVIDLTQPR
jgi:type IV pilus assembly protein PilQ